MENTVRKTEQINAISVIDTLDLAGVKNSLDKISQFQLIIQNTLKPNMDFGVIPGTTKPTLLKPGAEKILMLMGLTSEYHVTERIQDYDKGFFAFTVRCELYKNGQKITEGVGHCNTKEKKYVNQDAYTLANTCLKMAKKRAQIDATLTVASLSEVFTQDIEDMQEFIQSEQIETMTPEDAAAIKIRFGKFKGKTLKEIYMADKSYLQWLANQDRTDAVIKKAIQIMFDAVEQQAKQKAKKQERGKQDQKSDKSAEQKQSASESSAPFEDADEIEITDGDLPFDI